jgi:4-aminobutyrate aminotransferase-like enzyme
MPGGHSFTNSPLACAAGIATIEVLDEECILERVTERGSWLGSRLRDLRDEFSFIGDVRGAGYMWGMELIDDPVTAAPPDPGLDITAKAITTAARNRLILYPARFCIDGTRGDAFIVAPPLTSTDDELDELLTRLRATLADLRPLFPQAGAFSAAGSNGKEYP